MIETPPAQKQAGGVVLNLDFVSVVIYTET